MKTCTNCREAVENHISPCNKCGGQSFNYIIEETPKETFNESNNLKSSPRDRTDEINRVIVQDLISDLTRIEKYRRAINEGEFAKVSLIGTGDWEDYASLSLRAVNTLTLSKIDEKMEKMCSLLEKLVDQKETKLNGEV